jgi:FkbM family methyltransferase
VIDSIKCYLHTVGVRGLVSAIGGRITRTTGLMQMRRPDIRFPFVLRVPSSDVPTFEQIFIKHEYAFDVHRPPKTIVDAGANIGLASIYFASKFPDAQIIAIEPEQSNLEVLTLNTAPYRNISVVCGALWHQNAKINLVDPNLGKWGFMTQAQDGVEEGYGAVVHEVMGMTVDTIMKEHGIDHIDILKIDIEGAEREVFADASRWIGRVDALIVELHERMKPGCNRSFYNGSGGFDNEWSQGENVYLSRSGSCIDVTGPCRTPALQPTGDSLAPV